MYGGEAFIDNLPDFDVRGLTALLSANVCFWIAVRITVQHNKNNRNNKKKPSSWTLQRCVCYGMACSFVILTVVSPWNRPLSRKVYEVPLFSELECERILDMAAAVAYRNYQSALQENRSADDLLQPPVGWHKTRPEAYQTTDLQPALDPFLPSERLQLQQLFDQRLGPTVARLYGVPVTSIRAQDMFLARYEPTGRTQLKRHTDDTDVSFNILLSTNFTGGGTRFFHGLQQRMAPPNDREAGLFAHITPQVAGTTLIHHSQIEHEGFPVTAGTRFILVGFLTLDHRDPFSGQWTGLSWYASWGNLQWVQVRMRQFVQRHIHTKKRLRVWGRWIHSFCHVVGAFLLLALDVACPHEHHKLLVNPDQAAAFRLALDEVHQHHRNRSDVPRASWFRGQQITVHPWTGKLQSFLKPRQGREAHFDEL
jgi:hypothetical protein